MLVGEEHLRVAGLIWDWYRCPDENEYGSINNCGGALHVQLDDYNLEDELLEDWYWGKSYNRVLPYSPETIALGDEIVESLRRMSEAERSITVHIADPYGDVRPGDSE